MVGEGRFAGVGGWRAGDDGGTVAMLGDDRGEVVGDGACEEGGLKRVMMLAFMLLCCCCSCISGDDGASQ